MKDVWGHISQPDLFCLKVNLHYERAKAARQKERQNTTLFHNIEALLSLTRVLEVIRDSCAYGFDSGACSSATTPLSTLGFLLYCCWYVIGYSRLQ